MKLKILIENQVSLYQEKVAVRVAVVLVLVVVAVKVSQIMKIRQQVRAHQVRAVRVVQANQVTKKMKEKNLNGEKYFVNIISLNSSEIFIYLHIML